MPSWMSADKLNSQQRANVATIIETGRRLGASERDITIALMTAAQESEFRNIGYGDDAGPDSRGLFQQRAPWGTLAQRMDPVQATIMFFTGGHGGQRGLFDFRDRESMSLTRAAQSVQVSAYPDAYAKHQQLAEALLGSGQDDLARAPARERDAATEAAAPTIPAQTSLTDLSTPQTDLAAEAAKRSAAFTGPAGIGAATAPGLDASSAPGVGASAGPGLATPTPVTAASLGPPPTTALSRAQFDEIFPDAASTRMFSNAGNSLNGRRADVISTATSYIGTPYVWGGNDHDGVDCSGLVQQVYKSFGIDLPRLSADQARAGTRIDDLSKLRAGDLVAIDNSARNNGADHIAIYAGNGEIIEAPRPGLNVRRRKLGDEAGWYGVRLPQLG